MRFSHFPYRLVEFLFVAISVVSLCIAETASGSKIDNQQPQTEFSGAVEEESLPAGRKKISQEDINDISTWLKDVPLKTRRRGILPEETETYYQILDYARNVDTDAIRKAAQDFLVQQWKQSVYHKRPFRKFPVFVDMYQHPSQYQGRPVTMSGHIQRSVVSDAGSNDAGINKLCEAWLFTEDSQANPTVVVSTGFPWDFPVGEQIVDHVTVTGYIYRMYTYDARDSRRFAPLLMAHEIRWASESDSRKKKSFEGLLVLFLVILILGSLLGIIFLKLYRRKARASKRFEELVRDASLKNFDFEED